MKQPDQAIADFNIMMNTWEGAVKFSGAGKSGLEIAKLLGWLRPMSGGKNGQAMSHIPVVLRAYAEKKLGLKETKAPTWKPDFGALQKLR